MASLKKQCNKTFKNCISLILIRMIVLVWKREAVKVV